MTVTIYHNPRCQKSREALALIHQLGVSHQVVEYLKTPFTAEALQTLLQQLGFSSPRQLMRKKESVYRSNGLDDAGMSDSELIAAMLRLPQLIERPIVVNHGKAVIARPADLLLEIM
jgi:arsenate reductase